VVRNVITYYISYTRNNQYLIFYYDQVAGDIIVGFRNICILKATKHVKRYIYYWVSFIQMVKWHCLMSMLDVHEIHCIRLARTQITHNYLQICQKYLYMIKTCLIDSSQSDLMSSCDGTIS